MFIKEAYIHVQEFLMKTMTMTRFMHNNSHFDYNMGMKVHKQL